MKKKLGHVVHIMAEDEYRYNFDTYSIFNTNYNNHFTTNNTGNLEEFTIPGAHADVGGGYNEEAELVYLGRTNSSLSAVKNKIILWNKKFNWLKEELIKEIQNKVFLKKVGILKKKKMVFI